MRCRLLVASLALCLPVASALVGSIDAGDVAASAGGSASLYSTLKEDQIVVAEKDDSTTR